MAIVYYFYKMQYDKYIGGRKLKKMGQTEQQCVQIERKAILSIRSMSQSLNSLFEEISMYQPSMVSLTASPIKQHTNSNTSFNYTPIKQFVLAPTFKKLSNSDKKSQNNPQSKPMKKKSVSSVHFTNYMKPIGNVSQKLKEILQKQKKQRQIEAEKEAQNLMKLKKKANQQYRNIAPKYKEYQAKKSFMQEAIASRLVQRQESQMSGATFQPKINKNIQINLPFQQRLILNEKTKQLKTTQIIKQVMKGQTYHPKLNMHKQSQSKIKSIWSRRSKNDTSSILSKSQRVDQSHLSEIINSINAQSTLKMKSIAQFDFLTKK